MSHGADILAGEIDTKQLARQLLLDVYVITAKTVSTQNREISHGLRPYFAPPSMRFSRQKYWSGLPFPSPEDLPDPGIEPSSPTLQGDALPLNHLESPWSVEKTINSQNGDLPQDGF